MNSKFIKTDRLYLRQTTIDDLENFYRLDSDPEVMKYIGDGKVRSKDELKAKLEVLLQEYDKDNALGIWSAHKSTNDDFIGWGTLKDLDGSDLIEVGYRLLKNEWGYGYATEIAKALVKYGFEDLKLDLIVAITHKGNRASQKVIDKIGFEYKEERIYYRVPVLYYELVRNDYVRFKDLQKDP